MLQFEHVSLRQGAFELVADIAVKPGAVTAVLGPSGSGKSTLLSLAAGFLAPDQGRVLADGRDITHLDPSERPMSVVFQDGNLFPHLDIATNIALGISPRGKIDASAKAEVERVLDAVGLAGFGARRPAEVSGGQQSRAALARALLRKRPIVLLDEPFAALGPALRAEMLDLVKEVFAGSTVLMVTHAPEDASRIAAETIFIEEGRASPPVETKRLLSNPSTGLAAYLG